MATCGSLQHIFDSLLPENPTLIESLSWNNQIKPIGSIDQSPSFTEIFGELHFKESSPVSSPSSSTEINNNTKLNQNEEHSLACDTSQTQSSASILSSTTITNYTYRHTSSDSFSSLSSESLHLCTEGLGFESSDDVEDLKINGVNESCWEAYNEKEGVKKDVTLEGEYCRRSRVSVGEYPPPISCIGRSGKPWVCFKSYRSNGRFVLKEIRIPTQEFLHACREDGRLKLHFVHNDDEFIEEEEEEEEDVESMEDEDENMREEIDDCATVSVNEEK
ncbi:hypothetical protein RJT34_28709 [Clitoria ternatea]|uniref:FAF domain-containing protein n=1 Tax=Clitoria ternatea TaxID=43366 RepID=A0AAN9FEY9_CLITE